MKTVLYIDLYFAFNFSVDVLCLYLCGLLCSKRTVPLRLSAAAVIGSLYACASLFILNTYLNTACVVLVSFLMFYIAFGEKRILSNLFGGIALFSVSALFGGLYVSIISLFYSENKKDNPIIFAYIICAFISVFLLRLISSKPINTPLIAEIQFLGRSVKAVAIVDTANFLSEPISAKGVAVLSMSACLKLLEDDIVVFMDGINSGAVSEDLKRRIRFINIKTATGNRLSPCLRADKFVIINGKSRTECELYFTASGAIEGTNAECLLPNKINLKI